MYSFKKHSLSPITF